MPHGAEPAGSVATPPFDLGAATTFLNDQAECLAAGLRSADDPLAVRAVLRSHDGAHGAWLRLIAAVSTIDPDAGEVLATVYACHGRVAGSLERASQQRGDDPLPHVCQALSELLATSTAHAVAVLEAMDRSLGDPPQR